MAHIGQLDVFPIGLGCMNLSGNRMLNERPRAIATVHAALDSGINLLDTANIYAPDAFHVGHNEALVAQAVHSWSGSFEAGRELVVVTKGGISRRPGAHGDVWGRSARPEQLLAAARDSARRLGAEQIDVYLLHRLDPNVAFGVQIGALASVRDEGLARYIGLSNIRNEHLLRALDLVGGPQDGGIAAVQNEYSPSYRRDSDVLETCRQQGIAFLPWSPLCGTSQSAAVGTRYAAFAEVAQAHDVTAQQVALAWLIAQGDSVIPIPGSTRPVTVRASAGAAGLELSADEIARLDATEPADESVFPDHLPDPPM